MANLILDDQGRPKPQYEKPDGTGFEAWKGKDGHGNMRSDDGQIVALGSTADTSDANTVLGKLTKLLENLPTIVDTPVIPGDKMAFVAPIFDGADPGVCMADARVLESVLPDGAATEVTLAAIAAKLVTLNALADNTSNPTAPLIGVAEELYNGTTWDRKRGNLQGTLYASQTRTANPEATDQINHNGRGIHVILNVTGITGTPSIVLKIEGKSASGIYYTLLEGAAITAAGTHVYKIMPWATPVANEAAADLLPRTWRITVTHTNADSITYSVDYAIDC
jgi:hypothetical protein